MFLLHFFPLAQNRLPLLKFGRGILQNAERQLTAEWLWVSQVPFRVIIQGKLTWNLIYWFITLTTKTLESFGDLENTSLPFNIYTYISNTRAEGYVTKGSLIKRNKPQNIEKVKLNLKQRK